MHSLLAPTGGRAYLDCDDTGLSGNDYDVDWRDDFDVSTPADPGSGGVYVCVYEVDYDVETDEVEVYPLYCYVEWME